MKTPRRHFLAKNIATFECLHLKTAIYALLVTVGFTLIASEGVNDKSSDLNDVEDNTNDIPDVTYYSFSNLTFSPGFKSSWYDEDDSDDFQTESVSSVFPTTLQPRLSRIAEPDASPSTATTDKERTIVSTLSTFSGVSNATTRQPTVSVARTASTSVVVSSSKTTYEQTATFRSTLSTSESQSSVTPSSLTSLSSALSPTSQTPPFEKESPPQPQSTLPDFVTAEKTFTTSSLPTVSQSRPAPGPRFCNITRNSTYLTKCVYCFLKHECEAGDVEEAGSKTMCEFIRPMCRIRCRRVYTEPACCPGYWGESCDECPGGSENPCNGNGECQTSNGRCVCQAEFAGTDCELCEDKDKYGQNCSQECKCVHGTCSNDVSGDGSCECESGYKGDKCDTEIPECKDMTCGKNDSQNWRCADINGEVKCICALGYEYDSLLEDCKASNPCNKAISPCEKNSMCEHTGPGKYKCTCLDGYAGDGIVCLPINPCQNNSGGCENTSTCRYTGPNQHVCLCKLGYENYTQGTGCTLTNMCTKTSCHPMAICETIEPLKFKCTCKEGYIGSGTVCYGNILERMKDINSNNPRFKDDLLYAINLITKFYAEPMTKHGPFTLFVPNDRAFRDVIKENKGFDKFLNDEDRAMQILRQHILIGQFRLEDLQSFDTFYTLQGNAAQLQIRVVRDIFRYKLQGGSDRAKILERDFVASNGMIHIVNNLLTLEPEILGNKEKIVMDLIKLEGTYNRFEMLITSAGLTDIFSQPNITVFAPENRAWDLLPVGTLDYLMNDEDGQEKLKVILKNHVFSGVIGVTHLINMQNIKSFANNEVKVTISNLGQIQLDGKVSVTQVNIPCSTGFYHHIKGVMIPNYMDQILPSRCPVILEKEVKGSCVSCKDPRPHCPQATDKPTDDHTPCTYLSRQRGKLRSLVGCAWLCTREVSVPKCCAGFYGTDCLPCPGGFKNPCNGRGECSDGLSGSGLCSCSRDFMGKACDQCRQVNAFGPYCNETCTCLYGESDIGPSGTGLCKKNTCLLGYEGDNCDKKLVPCQGRSLLCHAHSQCFVDDLNVARCQCTVGYEGDGDQCNEIDPCTWRDNGGCHQQATCSKVGPGVSRCECNYGWLGDGFSCFPKTPCEDHTDCDINANCFNTEPGQYHCFCKTGYRGDGRTCDIINLCVENNGGCHPTAVCTPLKAGERKCTCPDNLSGDGISCFGTIAQEVMVNPNLTRLAELLKIVNDSNNIMLDNADDNMTLFAPSDLAMEAFMSRFSTWNRTTYWQDEENVVWFLNFHTVYPDYSTTDLMAWEGVLKAFPTMYDGFSLHIVKNNNTLHIFINHSEFATVSQPGIPAINGYIHIIDKVLEPFLPDDNVPTLSEALAAQPRYSLFYKAMQVTGVLEQINNLNEYTVFVPTNDAIKQLNRTDKAEFIKYYIVPRLVFSPSIFDSDSVETLLGPQHRLLLTMSLNTMKVNGIEIIRSDILLDGGVMHEIGGVLQPVLNRCDFSTSDLKVGDCGDCISLNLSCPDKYSPLTPPRIIKYECSFQRYPDSERLTIGCQQICFRNITKLGCCGGYFGPNCQDCPGGAENQCSGNGRCSAGLEGNGTCLCDKGFTGPDCSTCEHADFAPPFCNVTYDSCGYRNGNCSEHAICSKTSSGVSCRCPLGYVGDGYSCQSQCELLVNGGCHPMADCIFNVTKGSVQCICKIGYHGNGTWCQKNIDFCASYNGGCDLERAICTYEIPSVTDMAQVPAKCTCNKGYMGNGKLCSTDIMDAVTRMPELRYFNTWIHSDEKANSSNITQLFSDHEARITLFLPISKNWQALDLAGLTVVDDILRLPDHQDDPGNEDNENQHFVDGQISPQWTLQPVKGQLINITENDQHEFLANDVKIVHTNIETYNGIIHLTESPIVTSEYFRVGQSVDGSGSKSPVVIACVVVAVIIVVALSAVGAGIYIKKHHEGILSIFKRSQSNSESNISFARLSAQEEDEDTFKSPDNAKYDNPIFNDPDLL